uniref:DUF4140 domain-containing protein n=1 Tax=Romanomermis culicivorax TaxID=13658 RepID=A0A915IB50_ROMCU
MSEYSNLSLLEPVKMTSPTSKIIPAPIFTVPSTTNSIDVPISKLKIKNVTVFNDRAEIVRGMHLVTAPGFNTVLLTHVSKSIDSNSIRIEGQGAAEINDYKFIEKNALKEKYQNLEQERKRQEKTLERLSIQKRMVDGIANRDKKHIYLTTTNKKMNIYNNNTEKQLLQQMLITNKNSPHPDFDAHIVAALDNDNFDFKDPENQLEDDFILKANAPSSSDEKMTCPWRISAFLHPPIRHQCPLKKGGFRLFHPPIRERICGFRIRHPYPHPPIRPYPSSASGCGFRRLTYKFRKQLERLKEGHKLKPRAEDIRKEDSNLPPGVTMLNNPKQSKLCSQRYGTIDPQGWSTYWDSRFTEMVGLLE